MLRFPLPALILAVFLTPGHTQARGAAATLDAQALSARIDELVSQRLAKERVPPAPPAGDAEFFRRLSLDLNGRIPSLSQLVDFLDDSRKDKRRLWIDELIDGPDNASLYVQHFTTFWRRQILVHTPEKADTVSAPLEGWLRKQVKANTPYNRLVYALLTDPEAVGFYLANENKPEELASRTSRLLLGVRLECAQCHDDRGGGKWKRQQFWEFAAFFAGLRPDSDSATQAVTTPREMKTAPVRIRVAETKTWVEPRFPDGGKPDWKRATTPRQALATWIARSDNPWFARAAVNRLWHYFFGVGLIDPVDGLGMEDNPPSHPDLLDELVRQFVVHDFDLKYLIRAIALSRTYQRSSRQTHPRQSEPRLFASAAMRALTPEQLYESLILATGYRPEKAKNAARAGADASTLRAEFLAPFDDPNSQPADFRASIQEALMMMNGKLIREITRSARSATVAAVIESKRARPMAKRIEELYLVTLSRKPQPEESKLLLKFVAAGDSKQRLRDILWSLLNSTEFILNH
jgi:hypothetical protein